MTVSRRSLAAEKVTQTPVHQVPVDQLPGRHGLPAAQHVEGHDAATRRPVPLPAGRGASARGVAPVARPAGSMRSSGLQVPQRARRPRCSTPVTARMPSRSAGNATSSCAATRSSGTEMMTSRSPRTTWKMSRSKRRGVPYTKVAQRAGQIVGNGERQRARREHEATAPEHVRGAAHVTVLLQHQDAAAGHRQMAGRRQPTRTRADHHHVDGTRERHVLPPTPGRDGALDRPRTVPRSVVVTARSFRRAGHGAHLDHRTRRRRRERPRWPPRRAPCLPD